MKKDMSIKQILESIDLLTEEITSEDTLIDTPAEEPEVEPAFNDGMSLADTLDAKAKIARCLEALKAAAEEFKNATAEKVDLLKDELLLGGIEELDKAIVGIESALAAGSKILGDSELNDAFKTELPQESEDTQETEETENEVETNDEEDGGDYDFDAEAGLDLLQ